MKNFFERLKNANCKERAVLISTIPLCGLEWFLISQNYFRYFGLVIVLCALLGSRLVIKELTDQLKEASEEDEAQKKQAASANSTNTLKLKLPLLKSEFKLQSELYGFVAILGFIFAQYRIGLDLDKAFSAEDLHAHPGWAAFQAAGLLIMLLFAILALSRKYALAKFEHNPLAK